MRVVGVTGNLASGKSEVARFFKAWGALVFDADTAARKAVEKGSPAYRAVIKLFGEAFLLPTGEVDRRKLAWHVFHHPKDLKKLNTLIHPGVIFECLKEIEKNQRKKGVLVLDVPLLFESKMEGLVDFTVVVASPEKELIKRSAKKGLNPEFAKKILSTQWPLRRKERKADFVIENNDTLKDLEKKARAVWDQIKKGERTNGH